MARHNPDNKRGAGRMEWEAEHCDGAERDEDQPLSLARLSKDQGADGHEEKRTDRTDLECELQ